MTQQLRTTLVLVFLMSTAPFMNPSAAAGPVPPKGVRTTVSFDAGWKFFLGDVAKGQEVRLDDSKWRVLDLPHDWSIEGAFSKDNPAGVGGGALPGGIGWYRKSFQIPVSDKDNLLYIAFDGVYRNSEVWINGHFLGKRPYGYSSFRYELTPYLKYGKGENVLAVRVDNSKQPNSRWYSGSGIYRNVWLVTTGKVAVDHWGTYVTTPNVNPDKATVRIVTGILNATGQRQSVSLKTTIVDDRGNQMGAVTSSCVVPANASQGVTQECEIAHAALWSVDQPILYRAVSTISKGKATLDNYETTFGIRSFEFDANKGFFLNGKHLKINGVCDHHDLGCLGAAVNTRAIERQLELLRSMGVNAIRTSHNPPAPELLNLCDAMGFIVLDEAFDMWKTGKTQFDYSLDWDQWHTRDLQDMVLRDRNHPSVCMWSIGNEVMEQWERKDSSGILIARELAGIIRSLDTTRPITAACNGPEPDNPVIKSGALDLIGYNYHQDTFADFPTTFPGKKFLATETVSALATRGHYDMPSDSIRRWPLRWDIPFTGGNPDNTCSSYDNCSAPWGSTQEETWKIIKKYDFLSGQFIWTGFDYLGEPTPYDWPSRSSYFGIIDLAGFPKDSYYLYQSEWTDKPVLHVFPHWNWKQGDTVDVWAYTNCEQVELLLNGQSLGSRIKNGDELHLMWRVPYVPGILKAIGRTGGKEVLVREIKTAGPAARIQLLADRDSITADGKDLSFVTVRVLDEHGTMVPHADNLVHFGISGEGTIAGVDNGLQTSLESFKANQRRAFNGECLVVVKSSGHPGSIRLTAESDGLQGAALMISSH